jgi:hypothetical protein
LVIEKLNWDLLNLGLFWGGKNYGICCCCLRKIFLIMGFLFWLNIARLDVYIYIYYYLMKKKLLEYVAIDALGVSFSLKLAVGGIWKR